MIKHYFILYLATLFVMLILDVLWLKGVAQSFYKSHLGDLLEFRLTPAIIFYLIYAAGILVFASASEQEHWLNVTLYASLLGFLAYATYDLTNMATLRNWPLSLTVIDILWGTFNTALSATLGWRIAKAFAA
jgi:uncharacterized membrane protein